MEDFEIIFYFMKTGSHCLSMAGLNGLELFSKSSTSPVASSHQGIPSACSDWLPVFSTSPSRLNLFPMVFFLFVIMKFHCSLLLLPCSFGLFFICVGMHMSRCIWRSKDSFLELTFSCCLVESRGWALSSGLPARPLPAEPSGDPPFPSPLGDPFTFLPPCASEGLVWPWEAQYGLLLNLDFPPLPNQGPHPGITSGHHRAVWSCCKVLACLRTLLGNADKPLFFRFWSGCSTQSPIPIHRTWPITEEKLAWGQQVLRVS